MVVIQGSCEQGEVTYTLPNTRFPREKHEACNRTKGLWDEINKACSLKYQGP